MDLVVEVATNMTRRGSSLPPGSRKASLLSQLPLSRRASICPGEWGIFVWLPLSIGSQQLVESLFKVYPKFHE